MISTSLSYWLSWTDGRTDVDGSSTWRLCLENRRRSSRKLISVAAAAVPGAAPTMSSALSATPPRNRINYGFIVNIGARRQPGLIVDARNSIRISNCAHRRRIRIKIERSRADAVSSLVDAVAGTVTRQWQLVRRPSVRDGLAHKIGAGIFHSKSPISSDRQDFSLHRAMSKHAYGHWPVHPRAQWLHYNTSLIWRLVTSSSLFTVLNATIRARRTSSPLSYRT